MMRCDPLPFRNRGLTIAELLIGFAVFTGLMVILAAATRMGSTVWGRASASSDSQLELRKAYVSIYRDLKSTMFEDVRVGPGPSSLAGKDGDALWFLSPVDPATGESLRTHRGRPYWQRNILYYLTVPEQHQQTFGLTCAGGQDTDGYEDRCPHKVLIRKVIDTVPPPEPDEFGVIHEEPEEILNDVVPYLSRPSGYNLSSMSEAGLEDATIVAVNILSFRAQIEPDPRWPGEIHLELRAAAVDSGRRHLRIGVDSLEEATQTFTFSVFPFLDPAMR